MRHTSTSSLTPSVQRTLASPRGGDDDRQAWPGVTSSGALNTVNEPLGVLPRSGRLLLRGIPAEDVHGAKQLPIYLPPNETLSSDPVHTRFLLFVGSSTK